MKLEISNIGLSGRTAVVKLDGLDISSSLRAVALQIERDGIVSAVIKIGVDAVVVDTESLAQLQAICVPPPSGPALR